MSNDYVDNDPYRIDWANVRFDLSQSTETISVYGPQPISMRDYFAAVALTGVIAKGNITPDYCAEKSYEYADAMMKARMNPRIGNATTTPSDR